MNNTTPCHEPVVIRLPQGGPLKLFLGENHPDGTFTPDLSGYHVEALLRDDGHRIYKAWSAEDGTVHFDVIHEDEGDRGVAIFGLTGEETAQLNAKQYTLEVALNDTDGRAIDRSALKVDILDAAIRRGIHHD